MLPDEHISEYDLGPVGQVAEAPIPLQPAPILGLMPRALIADGRTLADLRRFFLHAYALAEEVIDVFVVAGIAEAEQQRQDVEDWAADVHACLAQSERHVVAHNGAPDAELDVCSVYQRIFTVAAQATDLRATWHQLLQEQAAVAPLD